MSLVERLRADGQAGVGAGQDWSAEECAAYWARQCGTARRNAREAADTIESLREALEPFARAWEIVTERPEIVRGLTLASLALVAAYELSGTHYQRAAAALSKLSEPQP
jgi:plasmid stabilization system protein ParE